MCVPRHSCMGWSLGAKRFVIERSCTLQVFLFDFNRLSDYFEMPLHYYGFIYSLRFGFTVFLTTSLTKFNSSHKTLTSKNSHRFAAVYFLIFPFRIAFINCSYNQLIAFPPSDSCALSLTALCTDFITQLFWYYKPAGSNRPCTFISSSFSTSCFRFCQISMVYCHVHLTRSMLVITAAVNASTGVKRFIVLVSIFLIFKSKEVP